MPKKRDLQASWSQLESFNNCRLQFDLRYERRVYVPKNRAPFLVGGIIHDLIKEWVRAGYPDDYIKRHVVKAFKRRAAMEKVSLTSKTLPELLSRTVKGALRAEKLYRALKFQEHGAYIEKQFTIPIQTELGVFKLRGAFDVYDPEIACIFDLKNYADKRYHGDPKQLLTYAVAITEMQQPVEKIGFLYPLRKRSVETRLVTAEEIDHQYEEIVHLLVKRATGKVTRKATKGNHCRLCDYYGMPLCPATYRGRKVVRKRGVQTIEFTDDD